MASQQLCEQIWKRKDNGLHLLLQSATDSATPSRIIATTQAASIDRKNTGFWYHLRDSVSCVFLRSSRSELDAEDGIVTTASVTAPSLWRLLQTLILPPRSPLSSSVTNVVLAEP